MKQTMDIVNKKNTVVFSNLPKFTSINLGFITLFQIATVFVYPTQT
jgi:hypothetical protein